ncbi:MULTISPECIES: sigma-54 dependent transcriptional regulator [unclassified Fusibacter]|uniref:sigma-54-dependent transcriptional regulator n=1 Tax=unclassified Fusibacter TaxID=2624464 RepID=UPI001FAB298D|nr:MULTISPECIES: sigma-54 dependent transcriptional regulator [unclassified Fusibacter]MCK8060634.1 sigma-54 dependent transcriptional regulator [Fusibacter sp. A2]
MTNLMKILIIDDELDFSELLKIILERRGYSIRIAESGEEGIRLIDRESFDLVLSDLKMSGMSGMDVLSYIQEKDDYDDFRPHCIMITGFGSIENAVEAIRRGAFSYFIKSNNPEELIFEIEKVESLRSLKRENELLKKEFAQTDFMLRSKSGVFSNTIKAAEKVALTDANVLILGESGVGKEVIARYIHLCSKRKHEVFLPVNCYAFSESMIEAELYGHEKGAFTGSMNTRIGRFEAANKGTLFLDEIGDIPLSTQIKLLRNIETKEIERIGSNQPIATNFRLISATNKNLEQSILIKEFREDLYYRINTVILEMPPLRDRKEDIPLLIDYFFTKAKFEMKKKTLGLTDNLLDILVEYNYPGNIRELKNIIERLLVFSEGDYLTVDDLNRNRIIPSADYSSNGIKESQASTDETLKGVRMQAEREHITSILERVGNDMDKAAEILAISSRQLYNKIKEFKGLGS